jgi:hypothetical protein
VREVFEIRPIDLLQSVAEPIRGLEAWDESPAAPQVRSSIDQARELFIDTARPKALYEAIAAADFDFVYRGDGGNEENTPLEQVLEKAVSLALFAVTLGGEVSNRISRLFDTGELAEGYILDQMASFAADELVGIAVQRFRAAPGSINDRIAVLPYSPGYCGWNVTGQQALFAHLEPGELGITLNDSCLMHPVKSVSGVLVLAPIEAHGFSPAFTCCATCTTLDCQERVAALTAENPFPHALPERMPGTSAAREPFPKALPVTNPLLIRSILPSGF